MFVCQATRLSVQKESQSGSVEKNAGMTRKQHEFTTNASAIQQFHHLHSRLHY